MEDGQIVELFWQRDEMPMQECQTKYGHYCHSIAANILGSMEDAEECVNDTWFRVWNAIPHERPQGLALFLGKITRNLAIDRFRRKKAEKRGGGQMELCLDELEECIGESDILEERLALREILNRFLREMPKEQRELFLLRYWYFLSIQEIAKKCHVSEGKVKMTLLRSRKKLKDFLEKEEVLL